LAVQVTEVPTQTSSSQWSDVVQPSKSLHDVPSGWPTHDPPQPSVMSAASQPGKVQWPSAPL
jgi:hypothetical protein